MEELVNWPSMQLLGWYGAYIANFKNKNLACLNQWETTNVMAKPVKRVKRVKWVKSILAHRYCM